MSPVAVEVLVAAVGFVLSISCSMFVAGSRWGRIETDMRSMSDRLAKIEGMFTLKLREPDEEHHRLGR